MKKIIRKKKYGHERRTMLTHISQDAGAALAHFCRYGKKSGVVAFGEIERVHAKSHRNARISRAERPRLSRGRRRTALEALDGAREDGVGAIPGRHGRGGLGQHNKHDDNSGGPIARAGAAHPSYGHAVSLSWCARHTGACYISLRVARRTDLLRRWLRVARTHMEQLDHEYSRRMARPTPNEGR